ncbi:MAG TPA: DEAD/DEAH box helicase [Vulgatibacter sp.]|nr:DEAD/DEAH box helicase [Vulgatibacter sp.]
MPRTFESLGLSADLLRALGRAGYDRPTPIQAESIPPALAGRNVIGCAATGTGKTAAFMLPLLQRTAGRQGATLALVLAPTRELAQQIHEYVAAFGGPPAALVVGGVGMQPQIDALRRKPALVVATPGRLIDHLQQRTVDLSRIETLVLDEADRMLDMGFRPQLEKILARAPVRRQTLLFSATMAGEVAAFAGRHVPDPVRVEVHRSGTTAARAEQRIYRVEKDEKAALLLTLLAADDDSTLVFVRTRHRADKIARVVEKAGHRVTRLHGDRTQGQRKQALAGFKDGRYRVLVATDVAARGIDVEEIGHVINFDLPGEPEDYVHRIGRTARNQASGRATSFAEPGDGPALAAIERLIGRALPREPAPADDPVFAELMAQRRARERDPGVHGGRTRAQLAAAGLPARPPAPKPRPKGTPAKRASHAPSKAGPRSEETPAKHASHAQAKRGAPRPAGATAKRASHSQAKGGAPRPVGTPAKRASHAKVPAGRYRAGRRRRPRAARDR